MAELVTIPLSFFEITVDFERPDLRLWNDRASVVQDIFDALKPWSPSIDNIEPITAGKLSEQGFTMKLPSKRAVFFFGPAFCRFTRDDADWASADETITIIDAAVSAFVQPRGVVIATMKTAIGLHIQPRTVTFMDILNPFMAPQLIVLEKAPMRTMAVVAKWENRKITIDGSGAIANAMFLKIEREFQGVIKYSEIAYQLSTDETELFKLLGIEEVHA